ncbi:MAG TPA: hypothetical protein VG294_08680 [Solirubrobacteraceae bacterium]|jgi:hypothetical protein|nr:hypothetical protein [Solirubrobacteraceae bacterium]
MAPEFALAALLAGVVLLLLNLINSSWMGMGDVKLGLLSCRGRFSPPSTRSRPTTAGT